MKFEVLNICELEKDKRCGSLYPISILPHSTGMQFCICTYYPGIFVWVCILETIAVKYIRGTIAIPLLLHKDLLNPSCVKRTRDFYDFYSSSI